MRRSSAQNSVTEVLLCDTGVLLAAGNVKDEHHHVCLKLLRQADGPLLVPAPVMGEIGYLLETRVGPQAAEVLRRRRLHIAQRARRERKWSW